MWRTNITHTACHMRLTHRHRRCWLHLKFCRTYTLNDRAELNERCRHPLEMWFEQAIVRIFFLNWDRDRLQQKGKAQTWPWLADAPDRLKTNYCRTLLYRGHAWIPLGCKERHKALLDSVRMTLKSFIDAWRFLDHSIWAWTDERVVLIGAQDWHFADWP